jgi:hypothetical protein
MMSTAVAATVVALGRTYDRPAPLEHQETQKSDQEISHFHPRLDRERAKKKPT